MAHACLRTGALFRMGGAPPVENIVSKSVLGHNALACATCDQVCSNSPLFMCKANWCERERTPTFVASVWHFLCIIIILYVTGSEKTDHSTQIF